MSEPPSVATERGRVPAAVGQNGDAGLLPIARSAGVLEQMNDGYFELDRSYRYRRVNAAGARIVRMAPEQIIGRTVLELFPDVEQSAVHQAVRRVMAGGPAEHVETYYAPLAMWAINSAYPLPDGVAIVTHDITARKLAQQNLAFLAEASKALSSSLNFRRTLRVVTRLAVPRIADWCTVDMLDATGKPDLLAVAHVDPKKVRWARSLRKREPVDMSAPTGLPNALRTGRSEFYPVITEEMIVAAAKDERQLELIRSIGFSSVMIVPLVTGRRAIGAISFVAAESGRHFSPADLAMAEELASRAALAIENARLYEAAQRAIALRDDFIAVAAHELKTPVTSMKIYADALRRQAVRRGDEPAERSLVKINEQIDRLSTLIGDLLDVSKIESGRLMLQVTPVDLDALITEVVDGVQHTAEGHRIDRVGTVGRTVPGDRERLAQVFTNLLTNAMKYSPGTERVVVRLAATDAAASIEVQDFGIGIDREHHGRIFDRFYRVSSPDEKTFPGLGVGLYVTSEIVRRHGGTIAVDSEKGRGSTFGVTLPLRGPAGDGGKD